MESLCSKLTRLGDLLAGLEMTPQQAAPRLLQILADLVEAPVTALCVRTGLGWQLHVHVRAALDSPVARLVSDVRRIMERATEQALAPQVFLSLGESDETVAHLSQWVMEPLVVPDHPRGFVLAGGDRVMAQETAEAVKLLSVMAAMALSNGVLYRDLVQERDRANLLLEATVALNRATEVAELRRVALDHLARDLRMPQGIWLAGRAHTIHAVVGLLPAAAESLSGSALNAACLPPLLDLQLDGEPQVVGALALEVRRLWEAGIGFVPKLAIPVPLEMEQEIVLLGDVARPDYRPTPDELTLARTLAGVAAGVLRRNTLTEELRAARLDAIKALASAVDAKDHYTHSHSGNVSRLAEAIARHMGLGAEERELARLGGLLHDLGKIGIPEAILNKQSGLDPVEYLRIKQHPLIGEQIAASIKGLGEVARVIRAHHEHYDGTGYPDQLRGEQIPLAARIVAVVDSFDAMTGDRPYRKGMPMAVVLERLQEAAGSQLDPKVVNALVDYLARRAQRAA